ncbi:MAG: class I SAM-dependent methyltransferase [Candidatus Omnitrophica bacterium]|nr:class I SAM-dependent methyltransferase [Candidatus Omnitrophota bacterium]
MENGSDKEDAATGWCIVKSYGLMRPQDIYEKVIAQRALDGEAFFEKYKDRFIDVNCPACGASGAYVFSKYGFRHLRCEKCLTLFCSPRPSDELIAYYYNNYKAPQMWTELLLKADAARKALQYKPRVERMIRAMREAPAARGGVALDIGAGSGAFSLCLKNSGFFKDVIAMDFSDSCVKACLEQGLQALKGSIGDAGSGFADAIFINDLIEHLSDPAVFLKECSRVLKRKGFISIATPNGEGFDFKIMDAETKNITPPEHLNYFNTRSIGVLLERAGFCVLFAETPGILDVDIISKARSSGFNIKDKNSYIDYILDQDENVLSNFQKFISDNKLSSHMLVMAQKGE